ncbi:hypothetical protein ABEB36_012214 [Hypothenemus hampei]|uniref:Uncharacterized protein n=1 Tax=Hypothenemus hampei TaxID=57062 RepID=A0ABD1EB43_HYPHA
MEANIDADGGGHLDRTQLGSMVRPHPYACNYETFNRKLLEMQAAVMVKEEQQRNYYLYNNEQVSPRNKAGIISTLPVFNPGVIEADRKMGLVRTECLRKEETSAAPMTFKFVPSSS